MNLLTDFLGEAERRARQTALIDGNGRTISFAELAERSAALAGTWRTAGIDPGDRVLIAMGVGIDLYVSLAALWRLGAVAVLPEPALGLDGVRHAAESVAPKAFLSSGWYRLLGVVVPALRRTGLKLTPRDRGGVPEPHAAAVDFDHPALISFTSGSTGRPKAIGRSHGFLAAQNATVADLLRSDHREEVDLVAFPAFVIATLGLGITSVLPNWSLRRQQSADVGAIVAHMRRHRVTRALLPPALCERLVECEDPPPLRAIFTGGGPVLPDLMARMNAVWPDAEIVAVYGSTEAEPIAHLRVSEIGQEDWAAMRAGGGLLAGTPIPQIELDIRDDEIVVTGEHVNKGYLDPAHDASNKVTRDGRTWHRTGDAGRLDEAGRLWLRGRIDARIGALYPFEIEVTARGWPGVRRAALAPVGGNAVLAIEGDPAHVDAWRREAARLGPIRVAAVGAIPLDRRHRSKIDLPALTRILERR